MSAVAFLGMSPRFSGPSFSYVATATCLLSRTHPLSCVPCSPCARYKFVAIHALLQTFEVVLFADGDVVFLRPDFITHIAAVMGLRPDGGLNGAKEGRRRITQQKGLDLAAQCDLMGPVIPGQACTTEVAPCPTCQSIASSGHLLPLFHDLPGRKKNNNPHHLCTHCDTVPPLLAPCFGAPLPAVVSACPLPEPSRNPPGSWL